MKRAFPTMAGVALTLGALPALAQQKVPVMTLAEASARTSETFGAILGLRQLPSGDVIVNDAGRRRLVKLDPSLANPTVIIDSASGGTNSYGPRATPLVPYLADSSLFLDGASLSLVVIDPKGQVSRVMAAPKPQDLRFLGGAPAYTDDKGRLLYRVPVTVIQNAPQNPGERPKPMSPPDSASVVRADFDTRQVDTVGRVKTGNGTKVTTEPGADGKMSIKMTVNPVQTVDDWAVLSDGSLAFVRGHDYHVDVIQPDGKVVTGSKLPFDWKRLTDEDKQHLIDSARTANENAQKAASANAAGASGAASGSSASRAATEERMVFVVGSSGGGSGGGSGSGMTMNGGPPNQTVQFGAAPKIDFVPLNEIADYYPAIRPGAARPDMDGNLWILTTTSAQSLNGELIYDVVNKVGELTHRVRIPQGRSIAGFGRNGVVYLMHGDRTNGFFLERSNIVHGGGAGGQ